MPVEMQSSQRILWKRTVFLHPSIPFINSSATVYTVRREEGQVEMFSFPRLHRGHLPQQLAQHEPNLHGYFPFVN
jgi:hypothetical protein